MLGIGRWEEMPGEVGGTCSGVRHYFTLDENTSSHDAFYAQRRSAEIAMQ